MGTGVRGVQAVKTVYLLRKPLRELTVASQVVSTGTGGINIRVCRVPAPGEVVQTHARSREASKKENRPIYGVFNSVVTAQSEDQKLGRWPSNLLLSAALPSTDAQRFWMKVKLL